MLRPSPRLTDRVRKIGFAVIAILCVVASVGYVYNAAFRDQVRRTGPLTGGFGAGGNELVLDDTVVLFENRTGNAEMGQVVAVRKGGNGWPRHLLPLRCLRLHFAAGNGICLAEDPDLPSGFAAYLFDASFAGNVKIALNGIPSRTRVSPDGRYGASTVFVEIGRAHV